MSSLTQGDLEAAFIDGWTLRPDDEQTLRIQASMLRTMLERQPETQGKALAIHGATIEGPLNLSWLTFGGPVYFSDCNFTSDVVLSYCRLRHVSLFACQVGTLLATGADVENDLDIQHCVITDKVSLRGARVGGDISFRGSTLGTERSTDVALDADRLRVEGGLFCRALVLENDIVPFTSNGTIRLVGADIQGQISLTGAKIAAGVGQASSLHADRARVRSGIYGRVASLQDADSHSQLERFEAQGLVRLRGAQVGSTLALEGARLSCAAPSGSGDQLGGLALAAEGCHILGDLFIDRHRPAAQADSPNTEIRGSVSLRGASIRGQMDTSGARLVCPGGVALSARQSRIGGSIVLRWSHLEGAVDLSGAEVGVLDDEAEAWPEPGKLLIDGLTYREIGRDSPREPSERLDWLRRQPRPTRPGPYEELAKRYKSWGRLGWAREISRRQQDDLIQDQPASMAAAVRRLFGLLVGHGYQAHRVVWLLIATVALLCGLAWTMGPDALQLKPDETAVCDPSFPCIEVVAFSADVSIPIVDMGVARKYSIVESRSGTILQVSMWAAATLGWLFTTVFAVGLARLVIRE